LSEEKAGGIGLSEEKVDLLKIFLSGRPHKGRPFYWGRIPIARLLLA
jgi:hypothetical protein